MLTTQPMPSIDELKLFDTGVIGGRITDNRVPPSRHLLPGNIEQVMDRHDIHEMLVTFNRARLDRPHNRGNLQTVAFCKGNPRLHPVWVLEPPRAPGRDAARAEVAEMRRHDVRVARLLFGASASAPLHWWWEDLLGALEERRVPCLLDFGSTDYNDGCPLAVPTDAQVDQLRECVLAHPALPMIISTAVGGLGIANSVLPLIHRVRNLHIDVVGLVDYWRRVAFEVGPERVVFATGMPYYNPATYINAVQYQPGLSVEAKKMICGDNMRRLMKEVR